MGPARPDAFEHGCPLSVSPSPLWSSFPNFSTVDDVGSGHPSVPQALSLSHLNGYNCGLHLALPRSVGSLHSKGFWAHENLP